jgi:phenylpropionate dioxygenase-like ring-hydroxylating dioxygenase large terminal subunit
MYINFWYPVCVAADLKEGAPLGAQMFGLPLVAFRDTDGQAHVLAETCAHRGGSLSRGKIRDGRLACPYHGWQYDGTGQCVHIPVLGADGNIPARAKVDSYPVIERYGIVFAFLGDLPEAERCPLCAIPEWDQPGWRDSGLMVIELHGYFERSIENGLDPVHNEFVHDLQGNVRFKPDRSRVSTSDWGSGFHVRMDPPIPGKTQLDNLRNDNKPEDYGASSRHHGPNTLVTTINLSKSNSFVQYFFEQPLNDHRTRIYFINMRNCMLDAKDDARIRQVNLAITDEDIGVVSKLYPVRTPEVSTREILIIGDECIGAYRRHLKDWENRGWRIDRKTLRENAGDVAYAIPCPARRTSKNWVLDPVPLVPA